MAESLTTTNLTTLVIQDDHLMVLEPSYLNDRIRRIPYEQWSGLTVWRFTPIWRIVLTMLLVGLPGLLIVMFVPMMSLRLAGAALLLSSSLIGTRYSVCGRTMLRIDYADVSQTFSLITSPALIKRFVSKLTANIRVAQGG